MATTCLQGITLQHYAVGEYDKILVLLTRERGIRRAIAKGAQRPRSKLGGRSEPLQSAHWWLAQGKQLDVVTQCETIHSHRALRGDLDRLLFAMHLAELVGACLHEDQPHPEVYDLLEGGLLALEGAVSPELVVAWIERALLTELGYGPELDVCVRCGRELEGEIGFSGVEGGALCSSCLAWSDTPLAGSRGLALLRRLAQVGLATLLPHVVAADMLAQARAMLASAFKPHASRAPRALEILSPHELPSA